jgi:hypothetical protein
MAAILNCIVSTYFTLSAFWPALIENQSVSFAGALPSKQPVPIVENVSNAILTSLFSL